MTATEEQDKSAVILRNQEGQVARVEDSAAGETPALSEFFRGANATNAHSSISA